MRLSAPNVSFVLASLRYHAVLSRFEHLLGCVLKGSDLVIEAWSRLLEQVRIILLGLLACGTAHS